MKNQITLHGLARWLLMFAAPGFWLQIASAQGTAFTYQGRLESGGGAFTGSVEFQPTLWDAPTNGTQVAANNPTSVIVQATNGLFVLPLDFGPSFTGPDRWLQLEMRTVIGPFTLLSPRQRLTPAPYAVAAGNLTGVLPAAQLSGPLPSTNLGGTYSEAVAFANASNSFAGSGAGLTGLNAAELASGTVPDERLAGNVARTSQVWLLNGNAGTSAGTDFIGTTDDQPLEVRVHGSRALRLENNGNGAPNVIGGSLDNFVASGIVGATIAGGGATNYGGSQLANAVLGDFGTVGGGRLNRVDAGDATVAGGYQNQILLSGLSTIAGGSGNRIAGDAFFGSGSAIGGGVANYIWATRGGGTVTFGGADTIAGGVSQTIFTNADFSTISGGSGNTIQSNADYATIGGGQGNTILADGGGAVIPGGSGNAAAGSAFAAGHRAKANHFGTFVWADATDADFASSGSNQFLIRASGGVGIGTTNPVGALQVNGGTVLHRALIPGSTSASNLLNLLVGAGSNPVATNGNLNGISFYESAGNMAMSLGYDGSGSASLNALRIYNSSDTPLFTFAASGHMGIGTNAPQESLHVVGNILATGTVIGSSDRNVKEHFAPVDPARILEKVVELPIQHWNYIGEATPHLGPVAQDFHAAFQVGADDKHIAMVDADGVALAAIQGLNRKLEQKECEITALRARLEKLERQLDQLANGDGK